MADSSENSGANKGHPGIKNLKPFKPGQSGNPGGRPKGLAAMIRKETSDGKELTKFMLDILRGENEDAGMYDKIQAVKWLSERGWGKPKEFHEVSGPDGQPLIPATERVEEKMREFERILASRRQDGNIGNGGGDAPEADGPSLPRNGS